MQEKTILLSEKLLDKSMKKFEYKFVQFPKQLGFDYEKKVRESEKEWNKLGQDGWQFCKEGNGVIIFIREIE